MVGILADENLVTEGVRYWLESTSFFTCPPVGQWQDVDVVLCIAAEINESVLRRVIIAIQPEDGDRRPPVVVVANEIERQSLVTAVRHGIVGFLNRSATDFPKLSEALVGAHNGKVQLSDGLLSGLLGELRESGSNATEVILEPSLSVREIGVLRLLADGFDTAEVASMLHYSERTIKNVIHDLVKRLGVRNRIQAVVYAVRIGII